MLQLQFKVIIVVMILQVHCLTVFIDGACLLACVNYIKFVAKKLVGLS